jgi:NAD(P)-dependent dehydrogenase (short-subunit alcohol dehydrogenase family)
MKRVLITGVSTGIGRQAVSAFLREGWAVLATMRRAAEREELFAEERARYGEQLEILSLDVSDPDQRFAVAERVMETGLLDCLVNNAGFGLFGALEDVSVDQLRRQFEVNFFGAALLTGALLPALRQSRGTVLFISSVLGRAGFPLTSAYCASKFAIEGLAESLYHELAPHGVRVGIIQPGGRRTRFGENIEWGVGDVDAYGEATATYRALLDRVRTRRGKRAPEEVGHILVKLASARIVPLRTRIGSDAAAMGLASVLPEQARARLFGTLFRRTGIGGRSR